MMCMARTTCHVYCTNRMCLTSVLLVMICITKTVTNHSRTSLIQWNLSNQDTLKYMDTSIIRTLSRVPKTTFLNKATSEMRTPH